MDTLHSCQRVTDETLGLTTSVTVLDPRPQVGVSSSQGQKEKTSATASDFGNCEDIASLETGRRSHDTALRFLAFMGLLDPPRTQT